MSVRVHCDSDGFRPSNQRARHTVHSLLHRSDCTGYTHGLQWTEIRSRNVAFSHWESECEIEAQGSTIAQQQDCVKSSPNSSLTGYMLFGMPPVPQLSSPNSSLTGYMLFWDASRAPTVLIYVKSETTGCTVACVVLVLYSQCD